MHTLSQRNLNQSTCGREALNYEAPSMPKAPSSAEQLIVAKLLQASEAWASFHQHAHLVACERSRCSMQKIGLRQSLERVRQARGAWTIDLRPSSRPALEMSDEMPLHVCRELRALVYKLLPRSLKTEWVDGLAWLLRNFGSFNQHHTKQGAWNLERKQCSITLLRLALQPNAVIRGAMSVGATSIWSSWHALS